MRLLCTFLHIVLCCSIR